MQAIKSGKVWQQDMTQEIKQRQMQMDQSPIRRNTGRECGAVLPIAPPQAAKLLALEAFPSFQGLQRFPPVTRRSMKMTMWSSRRRQLLLWIEI